MKLIIDIPEEEYIKICDEPCTELALAVRNGTPLDNLRTELEDYITHSPYIKSFMDCCRLRDDILRIVDKYKE